MKYIQKEDLDNLELNILPIRKGCNAKRCACLGTCMDIIGQVKREEANDFLSLLNTPRIEYNLGKDENKQTIIRYCDRQVAFFTEINKNEKYAQDREIDGMIKAFDQLLNHLK